MDRSDGGPGIAAVSTRDLDQAHAYIDRVFTPHRLVIDGTSALRFDLRYAQSARITVGYLTYGTRVMVDVPPPAACYHVTLPIRGTCAVGQRNERAVAQAGRSAAILSPDEPLTVRWEPDSVQYIVKVPRASLEAQLARLIGRPVQRPVRFRLGFDLGTGGGQALAASVPFLWTELSRPGGIATMPLAARWGFLHPSRFAQQYRLRFGVLPSQTLARA
jgi:hypothetical protein